eukprot:jgi/Tetstr1/464418/TSEL_009210.t1
MLASIGEAARQSDSEVKTSSSEESEVIPAFIWNQRPTDPPAAEPVRTEPSQDVIREHSAGAAEENSSAVGPGSAADAARGEHGAGAPVLSAVSNRLRGANSTIDAVSDTSRTAIAETEPDSRAVGASDDAAGSPSDAALEAGVRPPGGAPQADTAPSSPLLDNPASPPPPSGAQGLGAAASLLPGEISVAPAVVRRARDTAPGGAADDAPPLNTATCRQNLSPLDPWQPAYTTSWPQRLCITQTYRFAESAGGAAADAILLADGSLSAWPKASPATWEWLGVNAVAGAVANLGCDVDSSSAFLQASTISRRFPVSPRWWVVSVGRHDCLAGKDHAPVVENVKRTIATLRRYNCHSNIAVMALLPAADEASGLSWASSSSRQCIESVNAALKRHINTLTVDARLSFAECNDRFLAQRGSAIDPQLLPDGASLSSLGYANAGVCLAQHMAAQPQPVDSAYPEGLSFQSFPPEPAAGNDSTAWEFTPWSSCTATCGTGVQTRGAACKRTEPGGVKVSVPDALCNAKELLILRTCSAWDCAKVGWVAGAWGGCSQPCGDGGLAVRAHACHEGCGDIAQALCSGHGFCKFGDGGGGGSKQLSGACECAQGWSGALCQVDGCGVCDGAGVGLDVFGACCSGELDASGLCCERGVVDECGVCSGSGSTCDLTGVAALRVPPSASLHDTAERELRRGMADLLQRFGVDQRQLNVTSIRMTAAAPFGTADLQSLPHLNITDLYALSRSGRCGNGVCELGEP